MLGLAVQGTVRAHRLGVPLWHLAEGGQTGAVLAGVAAGHWARLGEFGAGGGGLLERGEEGLDCLRGEVLVVVVVDLDHGGIDASTQALNLDVGEEAILGGVAGGDAEVLVDCLDDRVGTAAAELAGGLGEEIVVNCMFTGVQHS